MQSPNSPNPFFKDNTRELHFGKYLLYFQISDFYRTSEISYKQHNSRDAWSQESLEHHLCGFCRRTQHPQQGMT